MKRIGITRLHMEEDAGKSLHDGFADSVTRTYIDLNRCGTPLVEIVSEPDLRTADEVFEYLTRSRRSCSTPASATATWKRARCAATPTSASCSRARRQVRHQGRSQKRQLLPLHPRRGGVRDRAPDRSVLEDGGRVVQESRLWNNAEGRTYSMRSKEQAHDYRYFPEPDLPPLIVGAEWQAEILKRCRSCPKPAAPA
jgi:aspartyl-tRNA(Asn)/glutamyl-tRNA(Gln) amidotransferase subunit B